MMKNKWKDKKIGVLMGGITKERDISLRTGTAISSSLKRRGYNVEDIDVGLDVIDKLKTEKIDVAFIALHGKFGEDGCIQGLLEIMRIPYTGSGVVGSSVGMDKIIADTVAKQIGIKLPEERFFDMNKGIPEHFVKELDISYPVVVKPSREGSTINISIVDDATKLLDAIRLASKSDNKIIVQQYIKGKELTVGLINGRALPVLEIVPKSGFYDYNSKYTKGMTEYIVPARISEKCAEKLQQNSAKMFTALDCSGAARCDFILKDDDDAYFLEINTIPGMTELSLVPKAAAHIGISFDDLVEDILSTAALKVN
ncbi:MAG: D-alanine--D-alanine ligase [Deltaproteobacteria bacterium CG07_land_8_20_14_0_80_38_7]|nr:MAG: D-alanine--D-alanine ligase [Deltaproteobacteria bacterium CG07_land_8_20_14_0_80_38_7]